MSSALFGRGTFLQAGNRSRQEYLDQQLTELRSFAVAATQEIRTLQAKVAELEALIKKPAELTPSLTEYERRIATLEAASITSVSQDKRITALEMVAAAFGLEPNDAPVQPSPPVPPQKSAEPSVESSAPAPAADAAPEST